MTSNLLIYYSLKGNTKGIIDNTDFSEFDIIDLSKNNSMDFNKYKTILIGTSTYGRGVPPQPFFEIKNKLMSLSNKNIGLFGSGKVEYEYFCGALDLLEEILKEKNQILFNFKFEGYPRRMDIVEFHQLIKEVE